MSTVIKQSLRYPGVTGRAAQIMRAFYDRAEAAPGRRLDHRHLQLARIASDPGQFKAIRAHERDRMSAGRHPPCRARLAFLSIAIRARARDAQGTDLANRPIAIRPRRV